MLNSLSKGKEQPLVFHLQSENEQFTSRNEENTVQNHKIPAKITTLPAKRPLCKLNCITRSASSKKKADLHNRMNGVQESAS